MLSEYEVQRLRDTMKRDLEATGDVVFTCAFFLLMLIGLACLGSASEGSGDLHTPPPAMAVLAQPESESKTVFDERRQRFIKAYPESQVARDERAQRQKDAHADGGYFAYQAE